MRLFYYQTFVGRQFDGRRPKPILAKTKQNKTKQKHNKLNNKHEYNNKTCCTLNDPWCIKAVVSCTICKLALRSSFIRGCTGVYSERVFSEASRPCLKARFCMFLALGARSSLTVCRVYVRLRQELKSAAGQQT
jgi:hypothetical protein